MNKKTLIVETLINSLELIKTLKPETQKQVLYELIANISTEPEASLAGSAEPNFVRQSRTKPNKAEQSRTKPKVIGQRIGKRKNKSVGTRWKKWEDEALIYAYKHKNTPTGRINKHGRAMLNKNLSHRTALACCHRARELNLHSSSAEPNLVRQSRTKPATEKKQRKNPYMTKLQALARDIKSKSKNIDHTTAMRMAADQLRGQ